MFANISRHPSKTWTQDQVKAALTICPDGILDIEFPWVNPKSTEEWVGRTAKKIASAIGNGITAAMVQGEYSLTLALAQCLAQKGIDVYVAALGPGRERRGKVLRPFIRFRKIAGGKGNDHRRTNTERKTTKATR